MMSRRQLVALALAAMLAAASRAAAEGLQSDVDQAVSIIEKFEEIPEKAIPREVMRDAKGLAILTVTKAGFVFSGKGGKGVVVARVGRGWSGPSGIATGGAGFGFQIGVEITEFVLVLNTPAAVEAFAKQANVTLGGALSVAAGPIGRNVSAAVAPQAAIYSYSRAAGVFAGISLEGTVIATRDGDNHEYYGRTVTAEEILSGKAKPPPGAERLIAVLSKH
jgi:lipid-binding SYLF domain-containing protein